MTTSMEDAAVQSIGNVCTRLREAIAAAIPVSPDQYMTVTVPGTVIDTTELSAGGSYVYDGSKAIVTPMAIQQAEAKLVDGMMPLANIMVGNTGKSVARSYTRTLDYLVPKKATVSTGKVIRSPGDEKYDQAMEYLTKVDDATGLTPVDVYTMKQAKWAAAQETWDMAKQSAQDAAKRAYPDDLAAQTEEYQRWNQNNFRKYKSAVQGQWMDWVTNGKKYQVEYNFGLIDIDSVMARIEQSKESMRNSSIVDSDGANELWGVELTPKNWATICKNAVDGWWKKNGMYSIEQLTAEINRLMQVRASYAAMKEAFNPDDSAYPYVEPLKAGQTDTTANTSYQSCLKDYLVAQAAHAKAPTDKTAAALSTARDALITEQENRSKTLQATNKYKMSCADKSGRDAMKSYLNDTVNSLDTQIKNLEAKRDLMMKSAHNLLSVPAGLQPDSKAAAKDDGKDVKDGGKDVKDGGKDDQPNGDGTDGKSGGDTVNGDTSKDSVKDVVAYVPKGAEESKPEFRDDAELGTDENNPWTQISVVYSSQDQSKTQSESSWGFSVGAEVGYGLWSVGGSHAHEQSKSDMQADMAACDVNITCSVMVVNIRRPWLYGELFADTELEVADGVYLSPGAQSIQTWIKGLNQSELAQYNQFPAYPTSFILASDTQIEFSGKTDHIENHFSAHSDSGSVSVGYGPWSVNSSFHHSASRAAFRMETTATGCKLSFGSPQVIGWVSQILPRLPRLPGFETMVQNVVSVKGA